MGSEKLTVIDLLKAGFDGVVDMGKTTPPVAFSIGFLNSLRRRCGELDKEALVALSLQAKQIQNDDIRTAIGDLYADHQELRRQLEDLAMAFVEFLHSHSAIPMSLDELLSGQVRIEQGLDRIQDGQDQLSAIAVRIEGKVDDLAAGESPTQFRGSDRRGESQGRFHGDIDAAAERLKKCDADGALALLEQLDKRHRPELTHREKYRLHANMGHAYRQKGDDPKAASSFLKAHSFQPEDEEALAWASLAHQLQGDDDLARECAIQAYTKNPDNSIAVARYLETMPEDTTLAECEKAVPEALSSDCQVLCELGWKAFRVQDYAKTENFARRAIAADSNECFPHNLLGLALLGSERSKANDAQDSDVVDAARLREAIESFDTSERLGKNLRRDHDHALLLVNRGAAYAFLKEYSSAEADLRSAASLAPDDPDVIYNLADYQHDQGNPQDALHTLSAIPLARRDVRCVLLCWDAAIDSGDHDAMRQAWEENRSVHVDLSDLVLPQRMTYLSLGSVIQASYGESDAALQFLAGPAEHLVPPFYRDLLRAQIHMVSNEIPSAKPLLQAAADEFDDAVPDAVAMMLVRYLHQAKLPDHAWRILKNRVSPVRVGNDTALLLNSALDAGHDDFVMAFCEGLRSNGVYDEQAINLEIHQHTKYHSFSKAATIVLECLRHESLSDTFKRLLRLRLSSLGIVSRRPELIERKAANLPHWNELKPEFSEAMVAALLETDTPLVANDFAYGMFRRFPDDLRVWRAVLAAAFFPSASRPQIPVRDVVAPDSAVRYREEDSATEHWAIMETQTDPRGQLDEISPQHPLAKAMDGMGVHDVVELPGPAGKATILEIVDKRIYRCRYCAENMAHRFSDDAMVWVIRGDPEEQHGETLIRRMLDKQKTWSSNAEQIIDVFRNNEMPLSLLALQFRTSLFEMALEASSESPKLPFRIAIGNVDEYSRTKNWLEGASRVVIDATAVASIVQLGLNDVLAEPQWSFSTSENVQTQVAMSADPILPGQGNELRDQVRQFLSIFKQSVEIGGGDSLARLQPRPSENHIQGLGNDSLSAIALAMQKDAVLWVDDRFVAHLANEIWGARAVNTQTFLDNLQVSGRHSPDTHYDLLLSMLVRAYTRVRLDTQGFEYAIKVTCADLTDPRLEVVLALLADDNVIAENVVRLSVQAIKCVWQQQFLAPRPEVVTIRVLENVLSRSDGSHLVRRVVQGIQSAFLVYGVHAEGASQVCRHWAQSKFL